MSHLVLYVLYKNGQFLTADEILKSITRTLSTTVGTERLACALQDLKNSALIVESTAGTFKITEQQRAIFKGELADAAQVTSEARSKFIDRITIASPNIDPEQCWDDFCQECLFPLIIDMGARTYEFVSDGTMPQELSFEDTAFFKSLAPKEREDVRTVILEYLAPDDEVVREFILRTLNAVFFLEATGLQVETLEKLAASGSSPKPLTLFLDTNLLFSVMDLHENPSNQSVYSLFQVMNESTESIPCTLLVLPVTVAEFKRTLIANRESLKRIAPSPNLLAAAQASKRFSGLTLRYIEACQAAGAIIAPEDYFNPYIFNPSTVMRSKGVQLLNVDMDSYESRQDIVNGINHMWDSVEEYRRTDSRYRAIKHDMILWHFVHDQRPGYVESLSEAGSWLVTIDFRLLRYDREAHNSDTGKPICIHPSVLVQMLRFWLPRSDAFEAAILESLRVPFIFRSFDAASEAVALRILEVLARYEVGDISPEAIQQLLVDDVLNLSLRKAENRDLETELVTERLSALESNLRDRLKSTKTEVKQFKEIADEQKEQLDQETRRRSVELEKQEKLQKRLDDFEAQLSAHKQLMFLLKWACLAIFAGTVATIVAWQIGLILEYSAVQRSLVMVGAFLILVLVVIRVADWRGGKEGEFENWTFFETMRRWRSNLFKALGLLIIGTMATGLWDFFKSIF